MNSPIDPEAGQPSSRQAYEQSDRNPLVTSWGGKDSAGGQVNAPAPSESRITQAGEASSPDAGLRNYDTGDFADGVEDEAEREG